MCSEPGLPDCLQLYSNRGTLLLPALSTLACYPSVQTQLFLLGIEGLFRCLITFLCLKASLQGPVLCQTCYNSSILSIILTDAEGKEIQIVIQDTGSVGNLRRNRSCSIELEQGCELTADISPVSSLPHFTFGKSCSHKSLPGNDISRDL